MKPTHGKYTLTAMREAERDRQMLLDYLHAHPMSSLSDVADAVPSMTVRKLTGIVISMAKRSEIVSTIVKNMRLYTAIERTTASAESLLAARKAKNFAGYCRRVGKAPEQVAKKGDSEAAKAARKAARDAKLAKMREEAERAKQSRPGHYIHKPGSIGPSHGGQGAVRPRTSINCAQVW